ncbi:hypothetical protein SEUCBS139899_003429 [Sporothrix eucalyptigena]
MAGDSAPTPAAPAAPSTTAPTTTPSVSWLHAYPPLPILASSAMAQPAGRLLGVSTVNSVWLRASPILGALDAFAVLVRGAVYCLALGASPRQAVVLLGGDRFDTSSEVLSSALPTSEDDPNAHERGTTTRIAAMAKFATATAIRLAGFGVGVVPLVELIWFEAGGHEAKWTAAWAWMFVGSYIILEIVSQVYRWEQAQPQYTAADFELDEMAEVGANQVVVGSGTEEGVPYDGPSSGESAGQSPYGNTSYAESDATLNDEPVPKPENHDDDNDDTAGLLSTNSNTAAATTTATPTTDVEANKVHPYEYNNDPSSHPRLPKVNKSLALFDKILLSVGSLSHAVFLYWAFLDLVQPVINVHMLAVDVHKKEGWDNATSWATPLYFLSMPIIVIVLFVDLALSLGVGGLVMFIIVGLGKLATTVLPTSVQECGGGVVPVLITVVTYATGAVAIFISFFAGSPFFGDILLSAHMEWIYQMLSLETVLFLLFCVACFLVYGIIKGLAAIFNARFNKDDISPDGVHQPPTTNLVVKHILQYTGEDSVALFFVFLLTLLLSLVWYAVRFAGSAHWAQHWADTLVANVTVHHNGTANSTLANDTTSTAAAAVTAVLSTVTAAATATSTPVQLF